MNANAHSLFMSNQFNNDKHQPSDRIHHISIGYNSTGFISNNLQSLLIELYYYETYTYLQFSHPRPMNIANILRQIHIAFSHD